VRVALVVPRSLDDDDVRRAATTTYRHLVAAGHEVDCFVIGDPRVVGAFEVDAGVGDRTRLCVIDDGFRSETWDGRAPVLARAAQQTMARVAARRLRALVTRANARAEYDAFVQPRWER
jgi:hypothetical protein